MDSILPALARPMDGLCSDVHGNLDRSLYLDNIRLEDCGLWRAGRPRGISVSVVHVIGEWRKIKEFAAGLLMTDIGRDPSESFARFRAATHVLFCTQCKAIVSDVGTHLKKSHDFGSSRAIREYAAELDTCCVTGSVVSLPEVDLTTGSVLAPYDHRPVNPGLACLLCGFTAANNTMRNHHCKADIKTPTRAAWYQTGRLGTVGDFTIEVMDPHKLEVPNGSAAHLVRLGKRSFLLYF